MLTTADMVRTMREFFEAQCMRIFVAKNAAYAQTDRTKNGLANFYEESASLGIDPIVYWAVLWGKHRRALQAWVRTREAPADIYKIINDLIVYELILYCLLVERGAVDHDAVVRDETN